MRRRSGNVVVVVAGGALVFLGLMSLVIDVGTWYSRRATLQAVADVAALAALRAGARDRDGAARIVDGVFQANRLATKVAIGVEETGTATRLVLRYREPAIRIFSVAVASAPIVIEGIAVAEREPSGRITLRP